MKIRSLKGGITIIEILATIAVLLILGSVSISVFSGLSNSTSFDKDVSIIVSYIEKSRTMSINSIDSVEHGVKLESNKVSLYKTTTFSSANTEFVLDIPNNATISTVSLTGNTNRLYFNKLTGAPSATGTIVVSSSRGGLSKTITIYATGVVDVQ